MAVEQIITREQWSTFVEPQANSYFVFSKELLDWCDEYEYQIKVEVVFDYDRPFSNGNLKNEPIRIARNISKIALPLVTRWVFMKFIFESEEQFLLFKLAWL